MEMKGVMLQEEMTMDETFKMMDLQPLGMAPALPPKVLSKYAFGWNHILLTSSALLVVSSSSESFNRDFDYTSTDSLPEVQTGIFHYWLPLIFLSCNFY